MDQPYAKAQSNPNVVDIPLFFHPNSLIINDVNGSFRLYEGVNGLTPTGNSPTQANLNAQIYGQQTMFGISFDYWSAVVIWTVKVPKDLHVQGAVNIKAYVSSDYAISGLMSGSGYSMGLADIDENENVVQQFMPEAPYVIGDNIFTSTPQLYSLDVNIDYVFRAGHTIGFAVGCGATEQGFTASVFFDSSDKPSGATLPVVDATESYDFPANSQIIKIVSNSVISDYNYVPSERTIQFTAKLIDYTIGRCNITIPKNLMRSPFSVTIGFQQVTPILTETQESYQVSFTHTRTSNPIQVTGNTPDTSTPTASTHPTTPAPTLSPNPTSTPVTPAPTVTGTSPTGDPTLSIAELLSIATIASAVAALFLVIHKKKLMSRKQPG